MMQKIAILAVLFFVLASSVHAETGTLYTLPQANKIEAERHMMVARRHFLSRDYFGCLEELELAQKDDIYLVSTYLLRALCQRRLGMWSDALTSIHYYLEVASADVRAKLIESQIVKERDLLKEILSGRIEVASTQAYKQPLSLFFNLPLGAKPRAKAIGKASCLEGRSWISDTEGNRIFLIKKDEKPYVFDIEKPVAAVPLSSNELIVATRNGQIYRATLTEKDKRTKDLSLEKLTEIPSILSDAVIIGRKILLVSDAADGKLVYLDTDTGKVLGDWRPNDKSRFEPLALSYGGYLVAIVDRGSNSLIAMDPWSKKVVFQGQADMLRDVEWVSPAKCFALGEDGSLYEANVKGGSFNKIIDGKLTNCWCLTRNDNEIMAFDAALDNVFWIKQTFKQEDLTAFANLHMMQKDLNNGTLSLKSNLYVPVVADLNFEVPSIKAGFGKILLASRWEEDAYVNRGLLYEVSSMKSYDVFLRDMYNAGEKWPSRIVLEQNPSLSGISDDFVLMLAGLCLREGIAVDLYLKDGPLPLSLAMLSHMSGGKIMFSPPLQSEAPGLTGLAGKISVELPERKVLFKEIAFEPLLAIFGNVDGIPFRDWVPIDFLPDIDQHK